MNCQVWILTCVVGLSLSSSAKTGIDLRARARNLIPASKWLEQEVSIAKAKLQENISPPNTARGVVIASPQQFNPNYYRHWVRDAALTMKVIFGLVERSVDFNERARWETLLKDYTYFARQNQLTHTLVGLGEPIFEVNGKAFNGPWGRPQNDGPALRAIVLTAWAEKLLDEGKADFVRTWLYDSALPTNTVIKEDLEYVSYHWKDSSFDLWEEVKGDHFFTKMVQRKALLGGARLAARLHDWGAAQWYMDQSRAFDPVLAEFWRSDANLILATLNRVEGVDYKYSGLDIAVILGVLHGEDEAFAVNDVRVQATFEKVASRFSQAYSINQRFPDLAPALGRYPEDIYAGSDFSGGNPWVLSTLAGAEYCYKMAAISKSVKDSASWLDRGDSFIQRSQLHAYPDGSLSEQIQKDTGYMTSAADLTWNYAAVLTTAWARELSVQKLNRFHKRK